jgi:hypothetical protein
LECGLEGLGAGQLQRLADGRRVEHLESLDVRIPTEVLEPSEDAIGVGFVMRRADLIGLAREHLHPIAEVVRRNRCVEAVLELRLVGLPDVGAARPPWAQKKIAMAIVVAISVEKYLVSRPISCHSRGIARHDES